MMPPLDHTPCYPHHAGHHAGTTPLPQRATAAARRGAAAAAACRGATAVPGRACWAPRHLATAAAAWPRQRPWGRAAVHSWTPCRRRHQGEGYWTGSIRFAYIRSDQIRLRIIVLSVQPSERTQGLNDWGRQWPPPPHVLGKTPCHAAAANAAAANATAEGPIALWRWRWVG